MNLLRTLSFSISEEHPFPEFCYFQASSLYIGNINQMTWALHIWNWHFLYYESSNTNPLENSPDQTPGEHSSSARKSMQIVHYKLKKLNSKTFLKNITLVSKIVKIVSKVYGVGLTRKDTLGFFTNCFLFIFSELGFLECWFTQVFCHCRNWIQKRNTSLSKKEKEKLQFCNIGWQCVHRRSRGIFGGRKVKEEIGKIRELAFRHKFSLSFIQSFEKAFRCSICHVTPAKLPLIACQACSTLLGCESCTNLFVRKRIW